MKAAGNILVVPQPGGPPRLAVIDALASIVELGLDGKLVAAHSLELEKGEVVSNLRTAVAPGGKRLFLAFASAQQRVHLLDENWKVLIHYPEDALRNPHKGVADVQLADLDGDGALRLYVGYWDVVGVQAASLEGKRLTTNRQVNNVRMAVGPADRGRRCLLCTNSNGPLVLLDSQLHEQGQVVVHGRVVQWLASADPRRRRPLAMVRHDRPQVGRERRRRLQLEWRGALELHAARGTPAAAGGADHPGQGFFKRRRPMAAGRSERVNSRRRGGREVGGQVELRGPDLRLGDGGDRRQAGDHRGRARRGGGVARGVRRSAIASPLSLRERVRVRAKPR